MRFDSFIQSKRDKKKCWIYPAAKDAGGYGKLKYAGLTTRTHRAAYKIFYGISIDGINVLHKCDNRPCCNPHHLFTGTARDNHHDAMKKGRHTRGEMMGTSKITELIVKKIRKEKLPQNMIAKKYGLCQSQISNIIRKEQWKHVN